jgi:hypothetical protein
MKRKVLIVVGVIFALAIIGGIAGNGKKKTSTAPSTPVAVVATTTPAPVETPTPEATAEDTVIVEPTPAPTPTKKPETKAQWKAKCKAIAFRVLDKDAGSLVGKRYVLKGQVFQIEDAGEGNFFTDFPNDLTPRTQMIISVTNEGYGFWTDNVMVAYNGRLNIYSEDIVRVWGTCEGQYTYTSQAGYEITVPLILGRYVSKL